LILITLWLPSSSKSRNLCSEECVCHAQVQEQGELTIRIDENIDDTLANVDSAQAQLLKYMNSISSNRWLVMKVFAVLLFFLFVFIFFIA
jgi:t-SNARE complex subunit (syntaxin)